MLKDKFVFYRKFSVLFFLCIVVMFFPFNLFAGEIEQETVRIAIDDAGLFSTSDDTSRVSGYNYEYLQLISSYSNWDIEYVFCDGTKDALQKVIDGEADLLLNVIYGRENKEDVLFPKYKMCSIPYSLFALASNQAVFENGISSFMGKKVGYNSVTSVQFLKDWCKANHVYFEFVKFDSITEKEMALEKGIIDLDYENAILKKKNFVSVKDIGSADFYMAANKNRGDLVNEIDFICEQILESNPYYFDNLMQKYFSKYLVNSTLNDSEKEWFESHKTLIVGYMDDFLPYCDTNSKGNSTGFVSDIVPLMLSHIDFDDFPEIEYISYKSFDDMFEALRNGKVDLVFPVFKNTNFGDKYDILLTDDIVTFSVDFVYKGNFEGNSKNRIAINRNDEIKDYFITTNYPDSKISYFDSVDECLQAVIDDKCTATVLNSLRTPSYLADKEFSSLNHKRLIGPLSFCFAVQKGNILLDSLINRAIVLTDSEEASNLVYYYANQNSEGKISNYIKNHKVVVLLVIIFILSIFLFASVFVAVMMIIAKKKLTEANKAKTAFLFNMSHDIRTPMNAIIGFSEIANSNIDDREKLKDCLNKITISSNLLLSLINSVLEISRIESGKAELVEKPGDIRFSFIDVSSTVQEQAKAKNINLMFELGDITDYYVYADVDRSNRIFINLISNSIKYTNVGGWIKVKCEQIGRDEDNGYYRYTFADNGLGMSKEFQKHLFEEFTRESNSTISGIQGYGLGLSVVKSIVDFMKGTIVCESEQGKGTTFTIELPFRLQKDKNNFAFVDPNTGVKTFVEEKNSEEKISLSGKKILLVEDNELNREVAKFILNNEKIIVEEAFDGSVAVSKIKENGPDYYDAVLMDIQMPVMNGLEATSIIRKMYPDSKLPIIAVSANGFNEDKIASIRAGMNAHIAKPINTAQLLSILSGFIKKG